MYYADWIFNFFSIQIFSFFSFLSVINWIGQNGIINKEMVVCWDDCTQQSTAAPTGQQQQVYTYCSSYVAICGCELYSCSE